MNNIASNINITPDMIIDRDNILCSSCGQHVFIQKMVFKKISALLSPSGQEELMPIEYLVCDACGELAPMYENDETFKKMISKKTNNNTLIL